MKKNILLFIVIIHITFFFTHCEAQWFKLPNLPDSGVVYDIYFVNANTGWITLTNNFYTLKTTNGGLNWITQLSGTSLKAGELQFFNDTIGIALGSNASFLTTVIKTSNGGTNWNPIFSTADIYNDLFFVNKDTGWTCGFDGMFGGVWKTTDGGTSWIRQYTSNSNGLDKIFFLKNKINGEYWGWSMKSVGLWRTTNSGVNWIQISSGIGVCNSVNSDGIDIFFKDTSNGIITRGYRCFNTTTNGGFNWINHIEFSSFNSKIGFGDSNKIWLTLSYDTVIKTTNFFYSYGKQPLNGYASNIFALDTSFIYAGLNQTNMEKTIDGGGPIIYAGIDSQSVSIPLYYSLYQNYPNPFNPATTIKFFIRTKSYISLSIFDTEGKEVLRLYDNTLLGYGGYKAMVDFGKLNHLSSGVYFYRLSALGLKGTDLYTETKKMVYIK
jgi:photosystem II stability/assembly factor-like uncharacterized protein